MTRLHHINCGTLHAPPNPRAVCHCLLLEGSGGLTLVDTGIGLHDVRDPLGRIGAQLIEIAGFRFDEADTAVRRIERLGLRPEDVTDIVLTHADPDHAGGLADFPHARVHISAEEHASLTTGRPPLPFPRYLPVQFAHGPDWRPVAASARRWFGLEARPLDLGLDGEVLLVPLFGHTHGHCGVAIERDGGWVLHAGDAYYLRGELSDDDHPVSALASRNAADDARRRETLSALRRLVREEGGSVEVFGYHDPSELPGGH